MFHWGQRITTPRVHVTWCGVVTRAWCLPIAGVALCLCVRESLQILASSRIKINSQCFKGIFADSSWSLRIYCSWFNSLRNADQVARLFQANLCRFQADRWGSIIILSFTGVGVNQAPSPPFPSKVSNIFGKYMAVSWVFFHRSSVSVTVPVGSCLHGWFLLEGLPWIPPCIGLWCSGPLPTLRVPVPKLISWWWV